MNILILLLSLFLLSIELTTLSTADHLNNLNTYILSSETSLILNFG